VDNGLSQSARLSKPLVKRARTLCGGLVTARPSSCLTSCSAIVEKRVETQYAVMLSRSTLLRPDDWTEDKLVALTHGAEFDTVMARFRAQMPEGAEVVQIKRFVSLRIATRLYRT